MRRPYLALITAAGLSLAVTASADAGGGRSAVGGGGAAFAPPGLRATNPANPGFTNLHSEKSEHITGAMSSSQTTGFGDRKSVV